MLTVALTMLTRMVQLPAGAKVRPLAAMLVALGVMVPPHVLVGDGVVAMVRPAG